MAEFAPGHEHGFCEQLAVLEHLRHRHAGAERGHLEIVQVDGDAVGLAELYGGSHPRDRVHPSPPPTRPWPVTASAMAQKFSSGVSSWR